MSDNPESRIADYEQIAKGLKSSDPLDRKLAKTAKDRLDSESPRLRRLRMELIEAHRTRNKMKIEELHHRIRAEDRYVR